MAPSRLKRVIGLGLVAAKYKLELNKKNKRRIWMKEWLKKRKELGSYETICKELYY